MLTYESNVAIPVQFDAAVAPEPGVVKPAAQLTQDAPDRYWPWAQVVVTHSGAVDPAVHTVEWRRDQEQ